MSLTKLNEAYQASFCSGQCLRMCHWNQNFKCLNLLKYKVGFKWKNTESSMQCISFRLHKVGSPWSIISCLNLSVFKGHVPRLAGLLDVSPASLGHLSNLCHGYIKKQTNNKKNRAVVFLPHLISFSGFP